MAGMIRNTALVVGILATGLIIALAGFTWTPARPAPDIDALSAAAKNYQPRIIRDKWGVPHIYGERDADVAFGLAYAHAEDDWQTIRDVVLFTRGTLAEEKGRDGGLTDYMIDLLRVSETIDEKYETDLSPEARAVAEAYAAGLTWWVIKNDPQAHNLLPFTGKDIIAGFVSRTPFFYGLDADLAELFKTERARPVSEKTAASFLFDGMPREFIGSNAFAVGPTRSADGKTRLLVNSHQPYTGPVAWYEARLKSDEGWDMVGSTFPGAPLILHGVSPDLGWAHTVNKPDLVDIYLLETDNLKKPKRYKFDGQWRDFERSEARFRVKLFGPFSWPIRRDVLWSAHGPVIVTDHGVYAIRYAAIGEITAMEQWYQMNRATTLDEWRAAVAINGIPSFNIVYADRHGNTGFIYNARMPQRAAGWRWRDYLPGDTSETLWTTYYGVDELPQLFNPETGFVFSANHTPFEITDGPDNPRLQDFAPGWGIETHLTNRAMRALEFYRNDQAITEEEFLSIRADDIYAESSNLRQMVKALLLEDFTGEPLLEEAQNILRDWDGSANTDSRGAALAILTGMKSMTYLMNQEPEEPIAALRTVAEDLKANTGRLDPAWGDINRLVRGQLSLPLSGGPDTLRAVYAENELQTRGTLRATGGDTHMSYAQWDADGKLTVQTIHQFGSATLNESSPHYADQAPLFARGEYKPMAMELDQLLQQATRDYTPFD